MKHENQRKSPNAKALVTSRSLTIEHSYTPARKRGGGYVAQGPRAQVPKGQRAPGNCLYVFLGVSTRLIMFLFLQVFIFISLKRKQKNGPRAPAGKKFGPWIKIRPPPARPLAEFLSGGLFFFLGGPGPWFFI